MVQYKCDVCKKDLSREQVNIISNFPRRIREYAVDIHGTKYVGFDRYGSAETHLCKECFCKIANFCEVVED